MQKNGTKTAQNIKIVQKLFELFQSVLIPTVWISINFVRFRRKYYIACYYSFLK